MQRAASDVSVLPGVSRRRAATSGRRRVDTRARGQPLVPLHRPRRVAHRLLRATTRGARRRLGASDRRSPSTRGWALTVYEPGVHGAPSWVKNAVIYQIFPDRFRNGNPSNDPTRRPGDVALRRPGRYAYPWGTAAGGLLPQLRRRRDATARGFFDYSSAAPSAGSPTEREGPRGRDYFGGDLEGVTRSSTT